MSNEPNPGAVETTTAIDTTGDTRTLTRRLYDLANRMALYDIVVVAYLALVPIALLFTPPTVQRDTVLRQHVALLATIATFVVAARTRVGHRSRIVGVCYRVGLASSMAITYVLLGDSLPLLNPHTLDRELFLLDLDLIGVEPAVLLQRWATPPVVDWFAALYMSYFVLLTLFLMPPVLFSKNERLSGELATVVLLTCAIGQTLYALVPGFGPLYATTEAFDGPLAGDFWFQAMTNFVSGAGAKKDIFPSLHTATPSGLTIVAYRYRHGPLMRWVWPLVAFATANIIVATLLLRWHYVIDVVAGLVLAATCAFIAAQMTEWDIARRIKHGVMGAWPRWPLSSSDEAP